MSELNINISYYYLYDNSEVTTVLGTQEEFNKYLLNFMNSHEVNPLNYVSFLQCSSKCFC